MWLRRLLNRFPSWRERRQTLEEFDTLVQEEERAMASDESNLLRQAQSALAIGDYEKAGRYWDEALVSYPKFARTSQAAPKILLGLGRFEEAEALMVEGRRLHPRNAFYAINYALVAERRGELEEAIRRWAYVRKKFSGDWRPYVRGGVCLRRLGNLDAGDKLHKKAIRMFPNVEVAWVEAAYSAERRADWAEAVRRWQTVQYQFRNCAGAIGAATGLEALGKLEMAQQQLEEAHKAFPRAQEVIIALGEFFTRHGDIESALSYWRNVQQLIPRMEAAYRNEIIILQKAGRQSEAESVAWASVGRFTFEPWFAVECALLAHRRQDWQTAAAHWAVVRTRWPSRQDGFKMGAEALIALGRITEAARLLGSMPR